MKRREFIKSSAAFCAGISVLSLAGCSPYRYVSSEFESGMLKVKKTDFLEDKWVVVRSEKANAPILLSKNENNTYTAVLMLCTHKQCEIRPAGTILACPCHGAEFSFEGKVLKEPAEIDLQIFQTSADESLIYINLK